MMYVLQIRLAITFVRDSVDMFRKPVRRTGVVACRTLLTAKSRSCTRHFQYFAPMRNGCCCRLLPTRCRKFTVGFPPCALLAALSRAPIDQQPVIGGQPQKAQLAPRARRSPGPALLGPQRPLCQGSCPPNPMSQARSGFFQAWEPRSAVTKTGTGPAQYPPCARTRPKG